MHDPSSKADNGSSLLPTYKPGAVFVFDVAFDEQWQYFLKLQLRLKKHFGIAASNTSDT